MSGKFFSVRCAILGYQRHGPLTSKFKHTLNLTMLDKLATDETKQLMTEFHRQWDTTFNTHINKVSKAERATLLENGTFHYRNSFHDAFVNCLIRETLVSKLSLRDGICVPFSVNKRLLLQS